MLEGKYKYNHKKRELKPVSNKNRTLHSIRLGDVDNNIFVNYKGKDKILESTYGVYLKQPIKNNAEAIVFTYRNHTYAYRVPEADENQAVIKLIS